MKQNNYIEEIAQFSPHNEQETGDQQAILWYLDKMGDSVLLRDNLIGHVTSSGFIMNPTLDKALMIYHIIRDTWAWTGGHMDGEDDLLGVAIREAQEETGVEHIVPLSPEIASIDILTSDGHFRRGSYVSRHLHLSVAFILICDESEPVKVRPQETTAIRWFPIDDIRPPLFTEADSALYAKLVHWAHTHQ